MCCPDGHQGVIAGGAGLENSFRFERPAGSGFNSPRRHVRKFGGDGVKIFPVVRPEIKEGALPCPTRQGFKKARLQQAVLVMTFFRPWIRKQNPDLSKGDGIRQRIDQLAGLGLDKVAVGELGALGLALGAPDPVADEVNAEAKGLRTGFGIARQEMSVPGTNLEHQGGGRGDERGQFGAQGRPAQGDMLDEFRFGSHESL